MPHVKHVCILLPLVRPHVSYVYVLLPLIISHVRHTYLGIYVGARMESRTTLVWSFGCGFACATIMDVLGLNNYLV